MYQAFLDFGLLKCIQRAEEPCWLAGRAATQQKGSWSSSSVSAWINPCINRIHTKLRKEIQPNPSHPTPEINGAVLPVCGPNASHLLVSPQEPDPPHTPPGVPGQQQSPEQEAWEGRAPSLLRGDALHTPQEPRGLLGPHANELADIWKSLHHLLKSLFRNRQGIKLPWKAQ